MANKYGVASDYIKYTSRIKSDTSDGVAVEASQVVDLEQDKLQSEINKELKASIASASGNTYSKSEIDGKDTATLTSAKSYADTKKTEAVSAAASDATTKANNALASAKSYADQKVSSLGSVYTTKGSCTAAQLKALTSAKAGDVWNITDAVTIDGKAYPAGVNVVCVTAFSAAIDPATTKNWDALQGLQDLTSYAKWSDVENNAINNVKFEREEIAQENQYTFKKTLTLVSGKEQETAFGLAIDPATSTKAGVMSAADKVKLDAVDGKIGIDEGKLYTIRDFEATLGTSTIGESTNIGKWNTIGNRVRIGDGVTIFNKEDGSVGLNGVFLGTSAFIGTSAHIGEEVTIDDNATIGAETIGTNLLGVHNSYENKIAIGNGVQITKGVGLSVNDDGDLVWGRDINGSYHIETTTAIKDNLSALASRVSALEDLLKLA